MSTAAAGGADFVDGNFAITVFVQRLQRNASIGDFVSAEGPVAIGIKRGENRRRGRLVFAAI